MMDSQDIKSVALFERMREHRFLKPFEERFVHRLAELGQFVQWPAGTIVFSAGDDAESCYLILDGLVVLEICDSVAGCSTVQTVGAGELLGWSALLVNAEMTSTARTQQATTAIELAGKDVAMLCQQEPVFGYQLMSAVSRTLARRLTASRLQLIDVYHRDSGQ